MATSVIICSLFLMLYILARLLRKRNPPLPPGPPGWPLIGNLFDFPKHAPHKTWSVMSRKYGPVMYLNLMGTQHVVLNSYKVADDLLEKRSGVTSNRPQFTMRNDLVGWGNSMSFMQYGDTYQQHRKFFRQQMGTKSSLEAFYPAEELEAKRFMCNLLKNPDDLITHSRRMASSVVLRISHGYTVKEDHDSIIEMIEDVMNALVIVTTPGRFLVDMLPILRYLPKWFPGGGFHKDAKQWREKLYGTVDTLYEFVLGQLGKDDSMPSFISRLLQEGVSTKEEEVLKWSAFVMSAGGSDTTSTALSAFFLAMTIHPEVLKKAQAEVDAVIGHGRLPTCEDRDALPYVNAICMELLRWHVLAPVVMHVTTQDIIYDGNFIPKETVILGNIWSILSDPETYPNPNVFDPERYLGQNPQPDPRGACFGWGKRSCPAVRLAELTLFICIAMAAATLEVSRCIENGVELVPKYDAEEVPFLRTVKPFRCRIAPRSKQAEHLLQA